MSGSFISHVSIPPLQIFYSTWSDLGVNSQELVMGCVSQFLSSACDTPSLVTLADKSLTAFDFVELYLHKVYLLWKQDPSECYIRQNIILPADLLFNRLSQFATSPLVTTLWLTPRRAGPPFDASRKVFTPWISIPSLHCAIILTPRVQQRLSKSRCSKERARRFFGSKCTFCAHPAHMRICVRHYAHAQRWRSLQ